MNGAQSVLRTLVDSGVQVCFANPGTSEMHFVSALDAVPRMRAVLCLFEGVVTGAADGYARMARRPAATLLHLGPGLGNGFANLHNARRAFSPMVNVVGEHASFHQRFDAPLATDIAALARPVSAWLHTSASTQAVGSDAASAVTEALRPPGGIATLILPADVSWSDGGTAAVAEPAPPPGNAAPEAIGAVVAALRGGGRSTLLLGAGALHEPALRAASQIAAGTGATVLIETFPSRVERGAGLPNFDRLGYLAEQASYQLDGSEQLILAGARSPATFFGYPDKPSDLIPAGCAVHRLTDPSQDGAAALQAVADEVATDAAPVLAAAATPELADAALDVPGFAQVIGAALPDAAIVVDESNTSGFLLPQHTAGAPRHDWLTLTGGSIGQGLPVATGAAVACPQRPVLCLEADGSAMYTISALWTHARENLDITTVVLNNSSYAILRMELQRVGADAVGQRSGALFDLGNPDLDFVAIAGGMGVPASRARTTTELLTALRTAFAEPGPHLIEAVLPALG